MLSVCILYFPVLLSDAESLILRNRCQRKYECTASYRFLSRGHHPCHCIILEEYSANFTTQLNRILKEDACVRRYASGRTTPSHTPLSTSRVSTPTLSSAAIPRQHIKRDKVYYCAFLSILLPETLRIWRQSYCWSCCFCKLRLKYCQIFVFRAIYETIRGTIRMKREESNERIFAMTCFGPNIF
jgi:hypothetical protein